MTSPPPRIESQDFELRLGLRRLCGRADAAVPEAETATAVGPGRRGTATFVVKLANKKSDVTVTVTSISGFYYADLKVRIYVTIVSRVCPMLRLSRARNPVQPHLVPRREQLAEQLKKMLGSVSFSKSARLRRFLEFAVDHVNQQGELKEYVIGLEVFDRDEAFDPRLDPIVRVEANRLRTKLKQYYEGEGKDDPILVEMPKGSYVPFIHERDSRVVQEPPPSASRNPVFRLLIAGAAALSLTALGVLAWKWMSSEASVASRDIVRVTSDSGLSAYPALSPDGKLLAYASDRGGEGNLALWIQPVSGGEATRLTGRGLDVREPHFSPDGTQIAIRSGEDGGGIYVVSVFGGALRRVTQHGYRPRFSPDGRQILYWMRDELWGPGRISVVPAAGGAPLQLRSEFADAHFPVWSEDGRHVLFCGTRKTRVASEEHDWWIAAFNGGPAVKTGAAELFSRQVNAPFDGSLTGASGDKLGTPASWAAGEVIFSARCSQSENLWRVHIAPHRWQVAAAPRRVTVDTATQIQPTAAGGRVAFASVTPYVNLRSVELDAGGKEASGEMKKVTSSVYDLHGSISADGKRVAFLSERSGNREIWIKDLDTDGNARALTNTQASEGYPIISPDGSKVVYRVIEDTWQPIYMVSAADGISTKVCADCGFPTDWSPDGAQVLYEPGAVVPAIWVLDLATGKTHEIYTDEALGLHSPRFSPEGRWVVFHAREEGRRRLLFVAPFARDRAVGRQEWIAVTDDTQPAHNACWSSDGNALYFLSERDGFRCIWGQRLHPRTKRPDGPLFAVKHFHTARMSLLMNVKANPNQARLSAVGNRLIFTMDELLGNIWMARL